MLKRMPDHFHSSSSRMNDTEYYIFCRASFAARQILYKQPRFTSELTDVHAVTDRSADAIDAADSVKPYLARIPQTHRTIILLHYAGRRDDAIGRYLGKKPGEIRRLIRQIKYDLGIEPDNPQSERLAA